MSRGGPSVRQLRVGESVRHALSAAFDRGEVHDPDLTGRIITITEVRMSPDLKAATAFFMPLGGAEAEDMAAIQKALRRAAPFLQATVARALTGKSTPRLSFQADRSFDEAARIGAALRSDRVRQDIESADGAADGAAEDQGHGPAA